MKDFLDQQAGIARVAAQAHLNALIECVKATIPEPVFSTLKLTLDDLGIFTESIVKVHIPMFDDVAGYPSVAAVFKYILGRAWVLEYFAATVGHPLTGLMEIKANTFQDAVLMSQQIGIWRDKGNAVPSITAPPSGTIN